MKLTFIVIGAYEDGKPDATFSFTDDDFLKVASGKMNPQIAFMRCLDVPNSTIYPIACVSRRVIN